MSNNDKEREIHEKFFLNNILDDDSDLKKEELGLFRSESAPPDVDLNEIDDSLKETDFRYDPNYFTYYYSQKNTNPRLPPPVMNWRLKPNFLNPIGKKDSWDTKITVEQQQQQQPSQASVVGSSRSTQQTTPTGSESSSVTSGGDNANNLGNVKPISESQDLGSSSHSLVDRIQEDFPQTPSLYKKGKKSSSDNELKLSAARAAAAAAAAATTTSTGAASVLAGEKMGVLVTSTNNNSINKSPVNTRSPTKKPMGVFNFDQQLSQQQQQSSSLPNTSNVKKRGEMKAYGNKVSGDLSSKTSPVQQQQQQNIIKEDHIIAPNHQQQQQRLVLSDTRNNNTSGVNNNNKSMNYPHQSITSNHQKQQISTLTSGGNKGRNNNNNNNNNSNNGNVSISNKQVSSANIQQISLSSTMTIINNSNDGSVSKVMEEFKSGKGRKFELKDIAGCVVEFSKDQHGSRFIQQKLEHATYQDKDRVFNEITSDIGSGNTALFLMTDVFGNYVIQKLFEYGLDHHVKGLLKVLKGNVLQLTLQTYGCRVVQKAIDVVDDEERYQLVLELNGNVLKCVQDQNGNHVIQKCIEKIQPSSNLQIIVDSFVNNVAQLATHAYGCRVIQRILEFCTEAQCKVLMDEIMQAATKLVRDQYGNYVVQHVLEHSKPKYKAQLTRQFKGLYCSLSLHKFASNVIEKCFKNGGKKEKQEILDELLQVPSSSTSNTAAESSSSNNNNNVINNSRNAPLMDMMNDQFGNYVVQKIMEMAEGDMRTTLLSFVKQNANAIKKLSYGKHIMMCAEKIEKNLG